jgi:hypothetical protein
VPLVACVATVHAASPVRLHVTYERASSVAAPIRAGAIREAAQIWAPYGITIDEDVTHLDEGASALVLVVFDLNHLTGEGEHGLGTIRFATDGIPDSTVTLYYGALIRLVTGSQPIATDARQWPAALRDQIIARALGRALAHELGHFVLRSPHHAPSGLMRARQHASALADPSRKAFVLTDVDRARLRVVLAAQPSALSMPPDTAGNFAGRLQAPPDPTTRPR